MWTEKNEKKKEILTQNIIRKELRTSCLKGYIAAAIMLPLFMIFLFLLYLELKLLNVKLFWICLFWGIPFAVICFAFIYDIFRLTQTWILIKKNHYAIARKKLISAEEKTHYARGRGIYYTYHLNFSGYDTYAIPSENYKWSNLLCMNDKDLFNHSISGDEYYLIIVNNKIKLVYPCKLFDC